VFPGGDELDAERLALEAVPERLALEAAPERVALPAPELPEITGNAVARFVASSDGTITVEGTEAFFRGAELQEAIQNLHDLAASMGTATNALIDMGQKAAPPVTREMGQLPKESLIPNPVDVPQSGFDFSMIIPTGVTMAVVIYQGLRRAFGVG
jgi:hypothetical protein